jgi:uncharacterized membrane protein YeaQ/YmgE (transglycosylase-associated protein family)
LEGVLKTIREAISLGGDTDTIAGMVGAIVGAHVGEKSLPEEWIEQLEELGERVLALHQQGRSVAQIVHALLGGPMLIEFITLGHFSRRRPGAAIS